jgi:hypothetical protein
MQTWATFSTTDHRRPIFRQALALFDRIVVPVPSAPIGDQTTQELDQLEADVAYLELNCAAQRYPWNSGEFLQWRSGLMAEALARGYSFNRNAYMDTRMMLREKITVEGVEAVPVYGDMDSYAAARQEIGTVTWGQVDHALTVGIAQMLPVPDYDTPLEDLVRLRESAAFQQAMQDLNEWKRIRIPAILLIPDHEAELRGALSDFSKLADSYARAMEELKSKRKRNLGFIFVSVLSGEALGAVKEGATTYFEQRTPVWKELADRKCAPGALVYQFQEAVH